MYLLSQQISVKLKVISEEIQLYFEIQTGSTSWREIWNTGNPPPHPHPQKKTEAENQTTYKHTSTQQNNDKI